MLRSLCGLLAVAAVACPLVASAAAEQPTVVDLIFNQRHLDLISKGAQAKYKFERKVNDEKLMGQPFSDDITLDVTEAKDQSRDVVVTVFSGARQRPAQSYESLTVNPVFIWYLDKVVENYGLVAGGKQPYLKGRVREAFVEKAKLTPVQIDYNGKKVDGYTISMVPFEGDPNVSKMQGFEKSVLNMTISKDIPGYFQSMEMDIFSSQAGTGKIKDHIEFVGTGAAK